MPYSEPDGANSYFRLLTFFQKKRKCTEVSSQWMQIFTWIENSLSKAKWHEESDIYRSRKSYHFRRNSS